jgi:hypothetical protein
MKAHFDKTFIELEEEEELVLVESIPEDHKFKVMMRGVDVTKHIKAIVSKKITEEDFEEHLSAAGYDVSEDLQGQEVTYGIDEEEDDLNPLADELDEE